MAGAGALDYYYGVEAEQYTFYRIPKVLFTAPGFRQTSSDAKILYGLMLDRMGLSMRSGWLDEEGRVFIYFTLEEAMTAMGCGHTKAVALFTELDKAGLIERKKQGQGRPTKIYVKNFVRKVEVLTSEKRKSALPETGSQDFRKRTQSILILVILRRVILIHLSTRRRDRQRRSRPRRLMGWIRYGRIRKF